MPRTPTSQEKFVASLPAHKIWRLANKWVGFKCRKPECQKPFTVLRSHVDENRGKTLACPYCCCAGRIP